MGVIEMTTQAFWNQESKLRNYAERLLDSVWIAALLLTFWFVLAVVAVLAIGVAVQLHIVKPLPQACHYMSASQPMDNLCK
jgi:hypothetical protein